MKKSIKRLGAFDHGDCINVVIETPKGSRVKYSYQPKTGMFALTRALPEGLAFPFNFGFIPGTEGEDGDPLDILIYNEEALIPGCLIHAELVAAIEAEQEADGKKVRNDRLIGRAVSKEAPTCLEAAELSKKMSLEIGCFFETYNRLGGKKFTILKYSGRKKALGLVRKAAKQAR